MAHRRFRRKIVFKGRFLGFIFFASENCANYCIFTRLLHFIIILFLVFLKKYGIIYSVVASNSFNCNLLELTTNNSINVK